MQGTIQSAATGVPTNQSNTSNKPANQTSANTSSFSDALKRAVAEREDKSANNTTNGTTKDGDVYAVVRKGSAATTTAPTNSVTSELITSPTINSAGKSDNRNFRELAEQKRLEFLKKKSDSKEKLLPPPPVISQSESLKADESLEARDEEDNSMSELQKIMSKLSVAKGEEPNNNVKKKPPPLVMKKPSKVQQPVSTQDHLSPVEEFPPPPPPHDFSSTANDILIPPPTFEIPPQIAALSPPIASASSNSKNEGSNSHPSQHGLHTTHQNHDVDNHSVTSSVGSDTISSVSQDGNRLSVATSGYSSDPSRSNKISISGKNVELWSTGEVGVWLDAIGLGEYKAVFAENCIEGETLISLSKADVKELGVEKVGHRVKLDKEIRKLIAESNA
ncbi:SHANK2 [Bugula neritina]|uniref:SHANK2 n=1 Tax=Bugula neritina TaxID=10212 RepID=A0A7J7JIK6_BUGNE|nr:SHANK2 [Bugula neritina]